MAYVIIIAACLLVVYAVYHTVQKARGKASSSCCGTPEAKTVVKVEDTDKSHYPYKYRVSIDGMMCSNCAAHVQNALNEMKGTWATVDLGHKRAEVLTKEEKSREDFVSALKNTQYVVSGFEQM